MTVEANKRFVEEFFGKLSNGDLDSAYDMLDDDVAWWSAGGENLAFSGTLTKAAFIQGVKSFDTIFSQAPKFTVNGIIAEGDRVAVELTGHAVLKDGRKYENLYHHVITIKNGKIIAAREYHDTLYAKIVLVEGQSSNSPV